jgi:hypothetical protein
MEENPTRVSVKPPSGFRSATTMVSPEMTSITRPSKARHSASRVRSSAAGMDVPGDGTGGVYAYHTPRRFDFASISAARRETTVSLWEDEGHDAERKQTVARGQESSPQLSRVLP